MFDCIRSSRVAPRIVAGAALATALLFSAPAAQAQVAAVVYGEPITSLDVDRRARLEQLAGGKVAGRKEVLQLLIDEKLKIREAKRFNIVASDSEVDDQFANMASRMRLNAAQFAEAMSRGGTSAATVKSRIRADIVWQRLVRGRYASTLTVGELDILNALGSRTTSGGGGNEKDGKDSVGYEYTLRPILLVVPENSSSAVYDARRRDAEALRGRFQNCDSGVRMARAMRDVAVRAPIVRTSADLPPQLRSILEGMKLGQLTPPEVTKFGVEVFALCSKLESRADAPNRKEARDALFAKRYEQQASTYLAKLRREALVEFK